MHHSRTRIFHFARHHKKPQSKKQVYGDSGLRVYAAGVAAVLDRWAQPRANQTLRIRCELDSCRDRSAAYPGGFFSSRPGARVQSQSALVLSAKTWGRILGGLSYICGVTMAVVDLGDADVGRLKESLGCVRV